MPKLTKRIKAIRESVQSGMILGAIEAFELLKSLGMPFKDQ